MRQYLSHRRRLCDKANQAHPPAAPAAPERKHRRCAPATVPTNIAPGVGPAERRCLHPLPLTAVDYAPQPASAQPAPSPVPCETLAPTAPAPPPRPACTNANARSVQRRAKAVHKQHPAAAACRRRACARSRCRGLHFAHRDPRHPLQAVCITVEKVAQALRKYHHPLANCHCWKYMLHQVRRRLHHAPCVAAQAHPASLARIRYQKVLAALPTPRPRKAVRQNAAL